MLLQVTTAMGNKSQGHATPTTSSSAHNNNNNNPPDAMVTSQPMRAGRSQAAMTSGTGGGEGMAEREGGAVRDGRERKRPENDGNILTNHTSELTGSAASGSAKGGEQKNGRNATPAGSQSPAPQSRGKVQTASYAQVLKTKSSSHSTKLPDGATGRPPSSKLSSRSQTPSECSLLGGGKEMAAKGTPRSSGGNSGSPVLSFRDDKGTAFLHMSGEDSVDFDLRSNSALSIATAPDSVVSERSASRQSVNLPLDSSQRVVEAQEVSNKLSGEGREEMPEVLSGNSVLRATDSELDRDTTSLVANTPTDQFLPPSPTTTSPTPFKTATSSKPHTVPVAPPTAAVAALMTSPPSMPSQPPPTSMEKQENTAVAREMRPTSPPPFASGSGLVPPSPGLMKENTSQVVSPSFIRESESSSSCLPVRDSLPQPLEKAPPTAGLAGDNGEVTGSALLMSATQKPSEGKEEEQNLISLLPMKSREGVLPNPTPTMSSILPHPPTAQMTFASTQQQQQPHLPLRPPGQRSSRIMCLYYVQL